MTWYEVRKREIQNGRTNAYTALEIWYALYFKLINRTQYDELITLLTEAA